MKIRRINLKDGNYIRIGDFVTDYDENDKSKEHLVTEIREGFLKDDGIPVSLGYAVCGDTNILAWMPFHAVTMVFFKVENEPT